MVQTRLPSRYRVLEEVGQGGMAVVYRAQDETLKREVAIKVLHPHLLAEPESKARLEREAQAVAKLQHDNILQVFDYSGTGALSSYIVTEFIDGQTLKQFFAARKTPLPEVAALIAVELGTALAHAHKLGIIHRDIKPENVMVRKDGMLKLMDFGVAQILDLERMTVTGQLLGSPAYMAPELFEGKPLDVRTDVFSVGVMLYQMATGQLPFSGRNPHEVLKRIAEGRFPDPRTVNRLVADRLTRIIAKALAKRPDDRYSSIDALLIDLRAYLADAGLENSRDEIKHFVVDPDGYEAALGKRIVCALVAAGRREQAAGKLARALECWNRALAIDPQNHDVMKALRKIEGRRRIYRAGVIVGGAGLLSGLIWGAFKVAREDVPAPIANAMRGPTAKDKPAPAKPKPVGPPALTQLPAEAKPARIRQARSSEPLRGPAASPHPDTTPSPHPAVTAGGGGGGGAGVGPPPAAAAADLPARPQPRPGPGLARQRRAALLRRLARSPDHRVEGRSQGGGAQRRLLRAVHRRVRARQARQARGSRERQDHRHPPPQARQRHDQASARTRRCPDRLARGGGQSEGPGRVRQERRDGPDPV
jgi:tRNA A-37 threonylcarbamoyl transferase component Bud32